MIVERAPAKLNLALHVRRRRADGYHDIETSFAFCHDGDVISLAPAAEDSFAITGPFAAGLSGETDNLVIRARDAFRQVFDTPARWSIMLEKNLPVASGIGGGSADAAATLRALARLEGVAIADERLVVIASALGADVPACLYGRSAIGRGRGDELQPVAGLAGTAVLLVNPRVAVSTARIFAAWDGVDRGAIGDGLVGRNDLTAPAIAIAPVIADVLAVLEAQPDCSAARMSGSGATCFGLFENHAAAIAAEAMIGQAEPRWWRMVSIIA